MPGRNLSLKAQLIVGFGVILSLIVIIAAIGYYKINSVHEAITLIDDVNDVKQHYAVNFMGSVHDRAIAVRDILILKDINEIETTLLLIKQLEDFYKDSAAKMDVIFQDPAKFDAEGKEILEQIKATEAKTMPLIAEILNKRAQGDLEGANALLINQARDAFQEWLGIINAFIFHQEEKNHILADYAREEIKSYLNITLWLSFIAFLVAIGASVYTTFLIVSSLGDEPKRVIKMVSNIANGNLNAPIKTKFKESMLASLAEMQEKLRIIVKEVIHSSEELNMRSNELAHISEEFKIASHNRAENAEGSVAQIVAHIKEIVGAVNGISNIAKQTEENSGYTTELSTKGREAMQITITAIKKVTTTVTSSSEHIRMLQKNSQDISGSAELIKEITDQTNLLALNAAIEAARAGEAGRGFAVVSDEIRKLAERTGVATSEISKMIEIIQSETQTAVEAIQNAVPQVENGMQLANEASEILDQINAQATDSLNKAKEVTKATDEQARNMEHLVAEFDSMAKDSKATAESITHTADAAQSLKNLADVLKQHISFFKI
ncbi:methyl-accepting chemotaxis protein [Helicobacter sp.]|uniref:methyl-accepting chemotaxis protein n=1 Tax=Helicobacter sp. TaxID=218 RepID=UPI0025C31ACA|nr:methyl-accepting chemotaxis protein [Helicobacter sp.]MCI5968664.1 methyl-accepting chemotaxis protein [Helicobacter sp.]MDY2584486.1 methyl-accepting chemotaxis protein [Helicobacter sp.]